MDLLHPRWCGLAAGWALALAGCVSPANPNNKAIVSVSAVNYAEVAPGGNLIGVVSGAATISPEVPVVPKPFPPAYYLMVPGEVFPSDVSMDAIYHQLRLSLEHRGYYNSVTALVWAGRPLQVDYLLRVHYGVRPWGTPTVRTDQVTWGNDGLVGQRFQVRLAGNNEFDPRTGLDQDEVNNLLGLKVKLQGLSGGHGKAAVGAASGDNAAATRTFGQGVGNALTNGDMTGPAHPFCIIALEAFRFADVNAMDRKAPCVWMIFIAVPVDHGESLSSLLPAMLKTAEPYYGGTTQGLQVFEVPEGKVDVGEPAEVPDKDDPARGTPANRNPSFR